MPNRQNIYHAIGLMSGTSLDGLDIAYCKFERVSTRWKYQVLEAEAHEYDDDLALRLRDAILLPKESLLKLDIEYGRWLGKAVLDFISANNLNVDIIASHGHTVFHQPDQGITLQVGSGQEIANITGLTVISDFRSQDVALGGQGAPLVPIGDELLFGSYSACLNLGGIANISFSKGGKRIAYDIGMANMPLNYLANQLDLGYDKGGDLARSGKVDAHLLSSLNALDYFEKKPPKSLGIEWFLAEMKPLLDGATISTKDKLATVVEQEAQQIGFSLAELADNKASVLVTGGGALNKFLIQRIEANLPDELIIHIPKKELVDFKEAIVFAFLGVLRSLNEVNCLSSVTGAKQDTSSGKMWLPQTG
jgi:anhydro-N-acetylmuramic acid kinase